MDIKKKIQNSALKVNDNLPLGHPDKLSDTDIRDIINSFTNDFNNVNFRNFKTIYLKNNESKREIKIFDKFSKEKIIIYYIKSELKKYFGVNFPNRNEYIISFFDTIKSLKDYRDFTILKVDFKDFFNSISLEYFYLFFISNSNLNRETKDLLYKYSRECKFCFAGIPLSNIISEIISKEFDDLIETSLKDEGLIFYRRYVDDCIFIFNSYHQKSILFEKLKKIVKKVFYKDSNDRFLKNRVKFNYKKTEYIARRNMIKNNIYVVDYLGYCVEFEFKGKKIDVKFGLSEEKITKYSKYLISIIEDYLGNKDSELLRHRLICYSRRTVYLYEKDGKFVWKSKGILSNYNQLYFYRNILTKNTESFLKNIIKDTITSKCGTNLPYFLKDTIQFEEVFCLYENISKNRALIFNEKIGISKTKLIKMCKQVNINNDWSKNCRYETILKDYLIRIGIGY